MVIEVENVALDVALVESKSGQSSKFKTFFIGLRGPF
jgi:hypothetical protein